MLLYAKAEVAVEQALDLSVDLQVLRKLDKDQKKALERVINTCHGLKAKELELHLKDLVTALKKPDVDFGRQVARTHKAIRDASIEHRVSFKQLDMFEQLELEAAEKAAAEEAERKKQQKEKRKAS